MCENGEGKLMTLRWSRAHNWTSQPMALCLLDSLESRNGIVVVVGLIHNPV